MKRNALVVGLICLVFNTSAYANEVKLNCTGEERNIIWNSVSPYSFSVSIDTKMKKFEMQEITTRGSKSYPTDNNFMPQGCPTPYWQLKVTNAEFVITTNCSKEDTKGPSKTWKISRKNQTFSTQSKIAANAPLSSQGTGKCENMQ